MTKRQLSASEKAEAKRLKQLEKQRQKELQKELQKQQQKKPLGKQPIVKGKELLTEHVLLSLVL